MICYANNPQPCLDSPKRKPFEVACAHQCKIMGLSTNYTQNPHDFIPPNQNRTVVKIRLIRRVIVYIENTAF